MSQVITPWCWQKISGVFRLLVSVSEYSLMEIWELVRLNSGYIGLDFIWFKETVGPWRRYALYWVLLVSLQNWNSASSSRQAGRYLGPGCSEPFGAGSLEAGWANLWFVGLVTAAVRKLLENTSIQPSTHHLTLTHTAPTCRITLTNTQTETMSTVFICVGWVNHRPLKVYHTYDCFFSVYLLPFLFNPMGGAISVTTGIDGQWAQRLVTLLLWHHYPTWGPTHDCTHHPSLSTHSWALAHTHIFLTDNHFHKVSTTEKSWNVWYGLCCCAVCVCMCGQTHRSPVRNCPSSITGRAFTFLTLYWLRRLVT